MSYSSAHAGAARIAAHENSTKSSPAHARATLPENAGSLPAADTPLT
jgi:hypothetical protein